MRNLTNELKNRSINTEKLLKYGFEKNQEKYLYSIKICAEQFEVIVKVIKNQIFSKLVDLSNNEEYILVDIKNSTGKFINKVRKEYEYIIKDIIENCTDINVFKSKQAQEIIQYITNKYQDSLEYLWEKFPDNAIWRNKKNNKWYGLLLTISEAKLKIGSDRIVEIIVLKHPKENIKNIIDNKKIFKGYHMNKNNWITLILDGSLSTAQIFNLIDISYELSLKK